MDSCLELGYTMSECLGSVATDSLVGPFLVIAVLVLGAWLLARR